MRAHHGFYVGKNKDIYALNRRDSVIFRSGLPVPILEDYITIFSEDGDPKGDISFMKAAKSELPSKVIFEIYRYIARPGKLWKILTRRFMGGPVFISSSGALDILHANSAMVIERDIDGLCKEGNVLISIRNLDLIVIFDVEKEKFVWKWGPGIIDDQHDAKMLDNDNILLFDNGYQRGYSRIIELNALTGEIVWEYKAKKPEDFYSPRRGVCQRLPNGNTLITESDRGRVFEVTYSGEIVWEFYNPEVKEDTRERKAFRKLTRIPNPQDYHMLKDLKR
jgi:outer membrane protein assembly factor BamB